MPKSKPLLDTSGPPKHLKADGRAQFMEVADAYKLDEHHMRLLLLACEALDRGADARKVIAKEGVTYIDRFGQPRARPEVAIERDSRIAFARLIRELNLDVEAPGTPRPPALRR